MRIAMVCPFGVRVKGTVPARVLPAARSLAARGHHVTVLIPPWDSLEDAGREERRDGLLVRYLPLAVRSPLAWPSLAWRLAREAWESKAEVLHCFKPKGFSGGVHFLTRMRHSPTGLPAVVVDSDDWEGPGGWNDLAGYPLPLQWLFAWQERWGLRHADVLTLASRMLVARAQALGVAPERACYLPNALEEEHPALQAAPWAGGPGDVGRVVLLYSRFWEFDPMRVARRLARVRKRVPDLEVWMAGRGRQAHEGRLRAALEAYGLGDAVRWLGWVEPRRLPLMASQVHVALVPLEDHVVNRARFPVKLLELMALGLAVAADPVGEVPEVLAHGEAGCLLPEGEVAWVAALANLLENRNARREMGARARARVRESYLWSQQAPILERVYSGVLGAADAAASGGGSPGG